MACITPDCCPDSTCSRPEASTSLVETPNRNLEWVWQ